MGNIVYIRADHIRPHPENPRKDLGDLAELADSIRKNGILQNLTVIPVEGEPGKYMALIGHRRLAAGVLAGVEEFPCKIAEGLSRREQLSIMLEENMQRSDLTIWEQANGFQMMLDLGETEESIAEKTGFSKATVRRRLNIAKLDQETLRKKEREDGFQLTLKDLYELEKVKDVGTRDKILRNAANSVELANRARNAATEEKRKENAKAIEAMLKTLGVEAAPKEYEKEMYSTKWKTLLDIDLENGVPKEIKLPDGAEKAYYFASYRFMKVVRKAPKERKELSEWERKEKEKQDAKRKIKGILKESSVRRKELVKNIVYGNAGAAKDDAAEIELAWRALVSLGAGIYPSTLVSFFLEKNYFDCTDEEIKDAQEKAGGLGILHQMLVMLDQAMARTDETFKYDLKFNAEKGDAFLKGYDALRPYGWYFERDEEKEVLDGTHELYKKKEQE